MSFGQIAAYLILAVLLLAILGLFFKPLKGFFAMALRAALGGVGLYICNVLLSVIGVPIGVNVVTASLFGLFGLPGFVLLVMLKLLFQFM